MANKIYKILVVGENAAILGFRGQGLEVKIFEDASNIAKDLQKLLISDEYAVVFYTPFIGTQAKTIIDSYREKAVPALIEIPMGTVEGNDTLLSLKESVKRAIGFDVLAEEETFDLPEEDYDYYA